MFIEIHCVAHAFPQLPTHQCIYYRSTKPLLLVNLHRLRAMWGAVSNEGSNELTLSTDVATAMRQLLVPNFAGAACCQKTNTFKHERSGRPCNSVADHSSQQTDLHEPYSNARGQVGDLVPTSESIRQPFGDRQWIEWRLAC